MIRVAYHLRVIIGAFPVTDEQILILCHNRDILQNSRTAQEAVYTLNEYLDSPLAVIGPFKLPNSGIPSIASIMA